MALQHAYAVTNYLSGLAAASFTWSNASATNRAYLNDGRMDKQFAATAASGGLNLIIDLGAATSLSAIAILNSNIALATSPTITIKGATDSGISSGVVTAKSATTPGTTSPRQKDHVLQFAAVSKRYWQILWTWTGSFQLKVGELFAAAPTALSRYNVFGRGETEEIIGTRFNAYNGEQRGHFIAGPYRSKSIAMQDLTESQRDEYMALWRASYAGALSMLWVEKCEAVSTAAAQDYQDCIYGKLQQGALEWREIDYGLFEPDGLIIRQIAREVGA